MVHIPGFGYDRRASLELPPGLNDPLVEAFDRFADLLFGVAAIQHRVQFRILLAEQDCRWSQAGEVLAPDEPLDPPIGIGVLTQIRDWFSRIFEVVELAPGHGVPDQVVHLLGITDLSPVLAGVGVGGCGTGLGLLVGSPVGGLRGPKFGCPLEPPLTVLCGPVIHRLPPLRLVNRPSIFADGVRASKAHPGDRIADVVRRLRLLPPDTTHLVVSVGGNDALGFAPLLEEDVGTVTDAILILAKAQGRFTADYDAMMDAVVATGLPTAVSTIYDTPCPGQRQGPAVGRCGGGTAESGRPVRDRQ